MSSLPILHLFATRLTPGRLLKFVALLLAATVGLSGCGLFFRPDPPKELKSIVHDNLEIFVPYSNIQYECTPPKAKGQPYTATIEYDRTEGGQKDHFKIWLTYDFDEWTVDKAKQILPDGEMKDYLESARFLFETRKGL